MGIDWSKAPEGATHWGPDTDKWIAGWYKIDEGPCFFWMSGNGWVLEYGGNKLDGRIAELIARPSPDWSAAPDWATHALTTGPEWIFDESLRGQVKFAFKGKDGEFYDSQGDYRARDNHFNIMPSGWVILSERPKPTLEQIEDE